MTEVLREERPETAAEFSSHGGLENRRGPRLLGTFLGTSSATLGGSEDGPEIKMGLGQDEVLCLPGRGPVHHISDNGAYFGITHAGEQSSTLWRSGSGALETADTEVRNDASRRVVQHRVREPRPPVRPRRGRQGKVKAA